MKQQELSEASLEFKGRHLTATLTLVSSDIFKIKKYGSANQHIIFIHHHHKYKIKNKIYIANNYIIFYIYISYIVKMINICYAAAIPYTI